MKTKPNEPGPDGQIRSIDILAMELDQKLPYWLSPQEKFDHTHDADRRRKHREYMAQKAKTGAKSKAYQVKEPDPQTTFMNECVSDAMNAGYPQDQSVAICLHVWYDEHPEDYVEPPRDRQSDEEQFAEAQREQEQQKWLDYFKRR